MNYINKILLSLIPYQYEREKIRILKNNYNTKELLKIHAKLNTKNLEKRIEDLKKYNLCFIDDDYYPNKLKNLIIPPFRISSTGDFPINGRIKFSTIGSSYIYDDVKEALFSFALSIAINKGELITSNYKMINEVLELAMRQSESRYFVLLNCGLDYVEKNNLNYKTLLSIFEPSEKVTPNSTIQMYEILSNLSDYYVVFQCSQSDECFKSINCALDGETKIFVHQSSVDGRKGCEACLSLYKSGCSMVSSFSQLASEENIDYHFRVRKK